MKTLNKNLDFKNLINEAKDSINYKGYFIAKNLINQKDYLEARTTAINYFKGMEEKKKYLSYPLRGYISAGMDDVIGYSKNNAWNLYRACFFSWNRPLNELSKIIQISKELSSLRNLIKGLPKDYGNYIEKNNYIGYTSLSNYPNDGGFLREHKDGQESDILHFKVELTHKGKDYRKGGFYLYEKTKNHKIDLSRILKPGDVAFFDGSQTHGIDPIYGGKGRIAFFEIPTKVIDSSRFGIYTNDGWSLLKRGIFKSQNIILPKIESMISKFINLMP